MTENEDVADLYPAPPPFYRAFTRENVARLARLREKCAAEGTAAGPVELGEADRDLEFLIPPQQPPGETYRSFGNIWHVSGA